MRTAGCCRRSSRISVFAAGPPVSATTSCPLTALMREGTGIKVFIGIVELTETGTRQVRLEAAFGWWWTDPLAARGIVYFFRP